jgi:Papain family cysteine protease
MLVVGYGQETDSHTGHVTKYWITRNSWGKGWVSIIQVAFDIARLDSFISIFHLTTYSLYTMTNTKQGEDGYVRVARGQGKGGVCGLEKSPSVALGGVLVGNHGLDKYRNHAPAFSKRDYGMSSLQQSPGNAELDDLNNNPSPLTIFCENLGFSIDSPCVKAAIWFPQHKPLCFGLSAMAFCATMALWLSKMDGRAGRRRRRQRLASESSSASRRSQLQQQISQSALSQHEASPLLDATTQPSYTSSTSC